MTLTPDDYFLIAEHYSTPHRDPDLLNNLDAPWIDSSKLAEYHLCPQRYAYKYEDHLRIGSPGPDAANFGSGLHAALASIFKGDGWILEPCPMHDQGPTCDKCKKGDGLVPRLVSQFLRKYPWTEVDGDRTQEKGLLMLRTYITKWRDEGALQVPGPGEDIVAVERPFILVFRDQNGEVLFYYVGRVDLIRREQGRLVPEDHKSTSKFGFMFESQFRLSYQMTGYMKAVQVIYGEDCTTAIIDALRVTKIISPLSFERFETQRYPEDFSHWETTVVSAMKQIAESRESGIWERRQPFACTAYNSLCPYFALCTSTPDHVPHLKEHGYRREVWNPLADDDATPIPPDPFGRPLGESE